MKKNIYLLSTLFCLSQIHLYSSLPNVDTSVKPESAATISENSLKQGILAQENNDPWAYSQVFLKTNNGKFKEIKVDAKIASNEIDFWVRQLSEHALFLHLGLEDKKLKKQALHLHKKFEKFREEFNNDPFDMDSMNSVLPLIKKERHFKVNVLKRLNNGEWIGWIFPLFVNHTILELDYVVDKLNGIQMTISEEIEFWNRINSEHAAFAAHLLDPQERESVLAADAASEKFKTLPNDEIDMWLNLSIAASKELDQFNKKARTAGKNVKSVIHPVLLDHVIREGERSILTLKNLLASNENSMEMMPEIEESYDALSQMQENANSMETDAMQEPQSSE
jgi:hypothetical protein